MEMRLRRNKHSSHCSCTSFSFYKMEIISKIPKPINIQKISDHLFRSNGNIYNKTQTEYSENIMEE